jgi:hypothetical protein
MNLHRLLAENMARFGTKNLSGPAFRTILNEGYAAGDQIANVSNTIDVVYDPQSGVTAAIAQYLGKYSSTQIEYNGSPGNLTYQAMLALGHATYATIQSDKEINKLYRKEATNVIELNDVINLLTGGVRSSGGQGNVQEALITKASELTKNITYSNTTVDIYPSPLDPKLVATVGYVTAFGVTLAGKTTRGSGYGSILKYLNGFNILNVNESDFTQYILSDMITAENFIDMQLTVSANNRIYAYTAGTKQPDVAGKELTSTTVGASAPVSKQYDVSFDTGVATIPANDAEVAKAVQDAIAMFPDGNISNLTVVSSASPEYNSAQGGPKTLADYGQNTTGTGDPGAGTDNIAKNKKLAYDRGVSFMTALNAGLEAQGKPAITGYTVNWQISDKGGSKVPGRYAEVQWEKAGSKGTEVPGAKSTGTVGATTGGKATFNMTQHEFSW